MATIQKQTKKAVRKENRVAKVAGAAKKASVVRKSAKAGSGVTNYSTRNRTASELKWQKKKRDDQKSYYVSTGRTYSTGIPEVRHETQVRHTPDNPYTGRVITHGRSKDLAPNAGYHVSQSYNHDLHRMDRSVGGIGTHNQQWREQKKKAEKTRASRALRTPSNRKGAKKGYTK